MPERLTGLCVGAPNSWGKKMLKQANIEREGKLKGIIFPRNVWHYQAVFLSKKIFQANQKSLPGNKKAGRNPAFNEFMTLCYLG